MSMLKHALLPYKCPFHNALLYGIPVAFYMVRRAIISYSRTITHFDVSTRFSEAIRHGNIVYTSGQVGGGATAEEATKEALSEVDRVLKLAGTDKSKILECTIWLADMNDYDAMNSVYDQWIAPHIPPTRACVQAKLAKPEYKVEVRVTAAYEA